MSRSYVVTGGGRGIGRAVVERLLSDPDNVAVVIEADASALDWIESHSSESRLFPVEGNAADEDVTERAADLAVSGGTLTGWVNNAAVFRDATLHDDGPRGVLDAITSNLVPALAGCATAVRRMKAAGTAGAIVNVSSHQAQRAVRGALPYATAKAAIEGLTRAAAVDYGPYGIRVNAVALGSVETERYRDFLAEKEPTEVDRIEQEMRLLHPIGRIGYPEEVAAAVAYLLSEDASLVNGAIIPVDGGRSALGRDPEEAEAP